MPIEKETGFDTGKERREVAWQCSHLHKQCSEIVFDCEGQGEAWKNGVAQDLSTLLGRAMYFLETDRDESDVYADSRS